MLLGEVTDPSYVVEILMLKRNPYGAVSPASATTTGVGVGVGFFTQMWGLVAEHLGSIGVQVWVTGQST